MSHFLAVAPVPTTVSTYLSPEAVVTVWFAATEPLFEELAFVGAAVALEPVVAEAFAGDVLSSSPPHAAARSPIATSAAMLMAEKTVRYMHRA